LPNYIALSVRISDEFVRNLSWLDRDIIPEFGWKDCEKLLKMSARISLVSLPKFKTLLKPYVYYTLYEFNYKILSHVRGSVKKKGFWIRRLDLLALILKPILIAIRYNSSQSMTVSASLHYLLDYECLLFYCD
jgi:hypothetical protein